MKRLILTLFLFAPLSVAQMARIDIPLLTQGPFTPATGGPLPQTLWVSGATVAICTHGQTSFANCQANPITTFTDATGGTPCPTNAQLTQLATATPTICSANAGTAGNVGAWYAGGIVDYWITSPYGTYGPFSVNPPAPSGTFATVTANVNRVLNVLAPPYNAKCDGTTLDDAAFQAAVTAVNAGGTLEFPPSTCKLSASIGTLTGTKIHIRGTGPGPTTLSFVGNAAIPNALDIEGASNVEVDNLRILGTNSSSTGLALAIKVRNSLHVNLHDLLLDTTGYGVTGTNPYAAISTENDYDVTEKNIRTVNSGGTYELVNGFNGHSTIGLHQSGIQDENNLTVISLGNFNCQWCTVDGGTYINQNNTTDSVTSDGYGILYYATNTTYALTCTGSGTLTCTVALTGGLTNLPVAPQFQVKIAGVTGGSGTINGTWDATLLTPTTFSVSGAGNAAGANFSAATAYFPTTNNLISDVHIKNTAGAAIYLQGCMWCTVTGWDVENTCIQEGSSTLPCGFIAINAGYAVAPIALNDAIGPGTGNGSGQNGIDFANTHNLSVSSAITMNNMAGVGLRDFSATQNDQFTIGGITMDGVAKCYSTTGTGTPHNGTVGPFTCSNFTTAGIFPNLSGVNFHDIQLNAPSFLPCVDDFQTNNYSNVWCNAGGLTIAGSGQRIIGGGVTATTGNHAVTFLGAQHAFMSDFTIDNAAQGFFFINSGATQPTDITIKSPHLINLTTQPAFWDQAPGAVTITTNTTTTVTLSTAGVTVAAGMGLGDYGAGGNNDLPLGDTIASCTPLSSGTCICPCTLTMTNAAVGSHASEAGLLQATMESGVNIWDSDIQANAVGTQGILFYGMQGLDLRRTRMSGFTTVGAIDLRGMSGQITSDIIDTAILTGSSNVAIINLPGGVNGSAGNIKGSNITTLGSATNSINDNSTATGNVWNNFTNNLGQAASYTDTHSTVQGTFSVSLTPAAATVSTCTEQSFTLSGGSGQLIQTGQQVTISPPSNLGVHLWIGSVRAAASNALVISFCADATGGTPPSGAYLVTAK